MVASGTRPATGDRELMNARRAVVAIALALAATAGGCGSCGSSSQAVVDNDGGAIFLGNVDGGHRLRVRNRPMPSLNSDDGGGQP
jgi:hypothetical protein